MTRRKIKQAGSGTHHNIMAARAHKSGAGRFEEPLPKAFLPRAKRLKARSRKLSTIIWQRMEVLICSIAKSSAPSSRNQQSDLLLLLGKLRIGVC
jgi:hypothetical protein